MKIGIIGQGSIGLSFALARLSTQSGKVQIVTSIDKEKIVEVEVPKVQLKQVTMPSITPKLSVKERFRLNRLKEIQSKKNEMLLNI